MVSGILIFSHDFSLKGGVGTRGEECKKVFACIAVALLDVDFTLQCLVICAEEAEMGSF